VEALVPHKDGASGFLSAADATLDEGALIDESSLLIFRIWMQLGGPSSPPTPQEIADMDAALAMDMSFLLRLYKRAQEKDIDLFALFDKESKHLFRDAFA
jgi:hypothetical protein